MQRTKRIPCHKSATDVFESETLACACMLMSAWYLLYPTLSSEGSACTDGRMSASKSGSVSTGAMSASAINPVAPDTCTTHQIPRISHVSRDALPSSTVGSAPYKCCVRVAESRDRCIRQTLCAHLRLSSPRTSHTSRCHHCALLSLQHTATAHPRAKPARFSQRKRAAAAVKCTGGLTSKGANFCCTSAIAYCAEKTGEEGMEIWRTQVPSWIPTSSMKNVTAEVSASARRQPFEGITRRRPTLDSIVGSLEFTCVRHQRCPQTLKTFEFLKILQLPTNRLQSQERNSELSQQRIAFTASRTKRKRSAVQHVAEIFPQVVACQHDAFFGKGHL